MLCCILHALYLSSSVLPRKRNKWLGWEVYNIAWRRYSGIKFLSKVKLCSPEINCRRAQACNNITAACREERRAYILHRAKRREKTLYMFVAWIIACFSWIVSAIVPVQLWCRGADVVIKAPVTWRFVYHVFRYICITVRQDTCTPSS
jgi:hypothetical protein